MKKLIALTLCLLLACTLIPVFTVSAADDHDHNGAMNEFMATKVHVVTHEVSTIKNNEKDAAEYADFILENGQSIGTKDGLKSGTMSFKDGTLTIENVTGVARVEAFTGSLIINVVGKNEFSHSNGRSCFVDDQSDAAGRKNSDLTITSSTGGSLTIKSKNYAIFTRTGNILIDGNVNLDVTVTETTTMQIGNVTQDGTITIGGKANVKLNTPKVGIDINRPSGKIVIKDNAVVDVTSTSGNYGIGIHLTDGNHGEVEIKDNAKVTVNAGGFPVFSGFNKGTLNVTISANLEATGSSLGDSVVKFAIVPGSAGTATIMAGDDAASAKKVSALDTSPKYVKITVTGSASTTASTTAAAKTASTTKATTAAKTADASVIVAAVAIAALSAAVIVKKKH